MIDCSDEQEETYRDFHQRTMNNARDKEKLRYQPSDLCFRNLESDSALGVIRYTSGQLAREASPDCLPFHPFYSSSMYFKCSPNPWPISLPQFYSLWSFYWSCFGRKCQDYDQSRILGANRECETQATVDAEEMKFPPDPRKVHHFQKSSANNFKITGQQQQRIRINPMTRNSPVQPLPMPSTCSRCNFHFRSPVELQVHWSRHGKHVCSICGRSFAQKANRDRHMCLHTGARPYPCDVCGEKFSRGDKLKIHKNRSHGLKY